MHSRTLTKQIPSRTDTRRQIRQTTRSGEEDILSRLVVQEVKSLNLDSTLFHSSKGEFQRKPLKKFRWKRYFWKWSSKMSGLLPDVQTAQRFSTLTCLRNLTKSEADQFLWNISKILWNTLTLWHAPKLNMEAQKLHVGNFLARFSFVFRLEGPVCWAALPISTDPETGS